MTRAEPSPRLGLRSPKAALPAVLQEERGPRRRSHVGPACPARASHRCLGPGRSTPGAVGRWSATVIAAAGTRTVVRRTRAARAARRQQSRQPAATAKRSVCSFRSRWCLIATPRSRPRKAGRLLRRRGKERLIREHQQRPRYIRSGLASVSVTTAIGGLVPATPAPGPERQPWRSAKPCGR